MLLEGIVGEGVTLDVKHLDGVRPSTVTYNLAKHLLYKHFRDPGEEPKLHLFAQLRRIPAAGWTRLPEMHRRTFPAQLMYQRDRRPGRGTNLLGLSGRPRRRAAIKAILDAYNPTAPAHRELQHQKALVATSQKHSHVNYVVATASGKRSSLGWRRRILGCWPM